MNDVVENLNAIIETGVKIHSVDSEHNKIRIIEGIQLYDENYKVLVSSNNVELNEEVSDYIKTDKFQNALFKPTIRGIILIDIANYSKGDTLYQASILTIFNQVINQALHNLKSFSHENLVEQVIPTGDGCYIVFNEELNDHFMLAVLIIHAEMYALQNRILEKFSKDIEQSEKLHIRVGCSLNETDFFYDAAGNRNCYGVGMNEAARILSGGQKTAEKNFNSVSTFDSVFFDETVYDQAMNLFERLKKSSPGLELIALGEVADKHLMKRKIWWLKSLPNHLKLNLTTNESNSES